MKCAWWSLRSTWKAAAPHRSRCARDREPAEFRGAATWNIRNSALNANSWSANRLGTSPIWYNRHQSTASLGGPIIKNKTFFFALYDRNDQRQKENVNALVLTPTARQGIFRFFPGVNNGNAES